MFKVEFAFIEKSGVFQSFITIFGSIFSMAISAIAMIFISRSLGPSKFGEFSVAFAILLILNKVTDLGLTTVQLKLIPTLTSKPQQMKLFSFCLRTKLLLALLLAIVGSLCVPVLIKFLNFQYPTLLYITFWFNVFTVCYEQLLVMLQSLHRFVQAVYSNALQATTKILLALLTANFFPENTAIAFAGYAFAPMIPFIFRKYLLPPQCILSLVQDFKEQKNKIAKLAGHAAIGYMAIGFIDNIDILIVQKYLNAYETGLLGGAGKIAMLVTLAGYALSTVLNARAARYERWVDKITFVKKGLLLSTIVMIFFLSILPFTHHLIALTIGNAYRESSGILQILLASSSLVIVTTPFTALFFSLKNSEWYFSASGLLQLIIIIVGNVIFVPSFGLAGSAWTKLIAKIVYLVFTLIAAMYFLRKARVENNLKSF